MLRIVSYFMIVVGLATTPLEAQTAAPAAPDTVRHVADLAGNITRHGAAVGRAIWPGYHPESIPTLYVIPHRAKLLVGWHDSLPAGFVALPGVSGAVWTDTQAVQLPSGRFIAFLSIDSAATRGDVLGLALHEAFHSFEHKSRRDGRRFGTGENALLVGRYPVFDPDNETLFAIEGRLLRRAYLAPRGPETRTRVCRYLAVRQRRQQGLDTAFVAFEQLAELNEGLAQYALLRGEQQLALVLGGGLSGDARGAVTLETTLLDSLVTMTARSVRRRFYATGATAALLLDRMAGPGWKGELVSQDRTVQQELEAVAHCTGRGAPDSLDQWIRSTRPVAAQAIAALKARRSEQAESLLARPGRRVTVLATYIPGHRFDYCGFDPQNLLQDGAGRTLHMRFIVLCSDSVWATIEAGAVEDESGTVRTVLDASQPWTVTAQGRPVTLPDSGSIELIALRIEAPAFSFRAPRATVEVAGGELRIIPRP
jgi:hypothetical protein